MNARFYRAPALAAGTMALIVPAVFVTTVLTAQERGAAPAPAAYAADAAVAEFAARVGTSLGPPGGETRSIVVAPTRPERLFVGTATGHIFRSDDAAATWTELSVNLGHESVVDNLLVHPDDADHVLAAFWDSEGTGGLAESRDGGLTWDSLPVPGTPSLRAIAMAPSDWTRLYVGGIGGVWRSDDAGATWRNINGIGLNSDFIESLAVDPRDPDHIYAGTWRQVYRTRDGGENWARIYQGMAIDRDIFSLTISPHDPDTVLAGTCNFLYRSGDAGGSWSERRQGLETRHNRVHVIQHDPRTADVLFAGTRGALYASDNAGGSWEPLIPDVTVSGIALDAANDRLYVATEERGVLVGAPDSGFVESNIGLTTARVVAFDALPGAPRVLFAARADSPTRSSVHYSTDFGQSWQLLGRTPTLGEIRFVQAQSRPVNRLLVVADAGWWSAYPGGRWEPLPAPPGLPTGLQTAADGSVVAATSEGLFVAAAENLVGTGGSSVAFDAEAQSVWQALATGRAIDSVAVSGDRLLATGGGQAISGTLAGLRSGDGREGGLAGIDGDVVAVALQPDIPDMVYAMTRHRVYRSDDGGARWKELPLPWPASELRALAVDPARPEQVLALDYRGAIYRGHDHGESWLILDEDPGLVRAWKLRVNAAAPGYALVATQGHGLRVVSLDPLRQTPPAAEE